jgi:hypothetical protein
LSVNVTHITWLHRNGFNPNNLWEYDLIVELGERSTLLADSLHVKLVI